MTSVEVIIVGGGRAGGSMALAAMTAGHRVSLLPGPSGRIPEGFDGAVLQPGEELPPCDLLVLAVSDGAIAPVSRLLVGYVTGRPIVVHLSGLTRLDVLRPWAEAGCPIGSLHPLMTLPDAHRGAASLRGSTAAITADDSTTASLAEFAATLGMTPRVLQESDKALYHAAAAAASNFVTAVLGIATDLASVASLPPRDLRPLTRAAVEAAFDQGADATLTGPIVRGDWSTVTEQLSAVDRQVPHLSAAYRALIQVTAERAGRGDEARSVLGGS